MVLSSGYEQDTLDVSICKSKSRCRGTVSCSENTNSPRDAGICASIRSVTTTWLIAQVNHYITENLGEKAQGNVFHSGATIGTGHKQSWVDSTTIPKCGQVKARTHRWAFTSLETDY